ncbi:MAG: hypothetical protein GFH27_549293n16 [Chloroflexi bacterium AL-W]|nr:hypothetical protein [Chloroflexi bacterium AL-N1]NOK67869.1 hypothetical protein [Chloroflexi bacterium AL-N10]NOK75361.1 hypothetical protein [Chloroflexi bacterium AL-N5]NOK82149.1 hypothetical protein [Chloroflexi bacterium AL-W]NOK89994.1 hypothetical protein [Chloroflexi bacterium AL-N15]
MVTHSIMSIFQFTPDDLVANRAGYATPKQTYRKIQPSVLEILFLVAFGTWTIMGTIIGCGIVLLNVLFTNGLDITLSSMVGALFYAFILVIAPAYMVIHLLQRIRQKRHDRHTRIVHRAFGPITLEEQEKNTVDSTYTYYFLRIGYEKLEITYEQYTTLQPYQNTNWKVYYFPHSKIIASLER